MKLLHGFVPEQMGNVRVIETLDQQSYILHFSLPGILPHYQVEQRDKRVVRKQIRESKEYYNRLFFDLSSSLPARYSYKKAFIYIIQFFSDRVIRDFDNRERKYVFDALRAALVIKDDNWQNMSVCESGEYDQGNPHTEIFISEHCYSIELFSYIQKYCISTEQDN
ncbi:MULTISPECIES: hypothetical protein [Paenibacillus]|uniref:hypothetical protein n=1 Tax=Paenibacillus TaxID=44249 RepID=UPI0009A6C5AD|nr:MULTISPECIES: hypothetical protein [Paenibacillus]MCZ1268416.1 hypothetical protein [Paenibacillus tundrae]SLK16559.1 hypothetical protein SAMN06272722_110192 [Paenibacillus sp. RU5A]SOC74406.1 hypothetical protein SAMN05880581_110192 [Paenibacillus sp. RU26A]SOC76561.1 hypothetical protein SAMN05880586_110192 [Paenibacillus sp. RU5M]